MWQYVYQDELYHYGVKGMKWGVRRQKTMYANEFVDDYGHMNPYYAKYLE